MFMIKKKMKKTKLFFIIINHPDHAMMKYNDNAIILW